MLANNLYYLYLASFLILRPRIVNLGRRDAARGLVLTLLSVATIQRRFIRFFIALYKAFRLLLFSISRLFCIVAALR
jgi:hypothetical protein